MTHEQMADELMRLSLAAVEQGLRLQAAAQILRGHAPELFEAELKSAVIPSTVPAFLENELQHLDHTLDTRQKKRQRYTMRRRGIND